MKLYCYTLFILLNFQLNSQSLCELKTPTLIYNKASKSYHIKDEIKPYKVVWYRNDTLIKTATSYRTAPQQLISIPNFRHFEVCPHVLRNGDIYFLGDSFWHYSVFKVNLLNKTYDRQFNLSDYVTENKDFLDSIYYGSVGNTYSLNKDSSHEITNCFVMDNDGMMYINKVYIKNFLAFNPSTKTYKLIDSFTNSEIVQFYKDVLNAIDNMILLDYIRDYVMPQKVDTVNYFVTKTLDVNLDLALAYYDIKYPNDTSVDTIKLQELSVIIEAFNSQV